MRSRRLALTMLMALGLYVFAAGCEKSNEDKAADAMNDAAGAVDDAAESVTAATQADD